MLEENFYAPILRRDPSSPLERWGELVADDLSFDPQAQNGGLHRGVTVIPGARSVSNQNDLWSASGPRIRAASCYLRALTPIHVP